MTVAWVGWSRRRILLWDSYVGYTPIRPRDGTGSELYIVCILVVLPQVNLYSAQHGLHEE